MVVESRKTETTNDSKAGGEGSGVYRPPQARMQHIQRPHRDNPVRVRRPDRAVYVPKPQRSSSSTKVPSPQSASNTVSTSTNDDASIPSTPIQSASLPTNTFKDVKDKTTPSPKSKRTIDKNFCNVYTPPHARSFNACSSENNPTEHLQNVHLDFREPPIHIKSSESSKKVPHKVILNDIVPKSECSQLPLIDSTEQNSLVINSIESVDGEFVSEGSIETESDDKYLERTYIYDNLDTEDVTNGSVAITSNTEHFDNITNDPSEYMSMTDHQIITNDENHTEENITNDYDNMENETMLNNQSDVPSHDINTYSPLHSDVIMDNSCTNPWNNEKDEDKDQKELIKASEEINRSNRRLIKQSFVSDVLIISETRDDDLTNDAEPPKTINTNEDKNNANSVNDAENPAVKPTIFNPDEEDWEAMFDENGDYLEPQLVEELTAAVGKVTVQKPHVSYNKYLSSAPQAFAHVLEVYNFPSAFTTHDLLSVFSDFKDTGFEIKWVDDNHALAVFSSTVIAAQVLAYNHPMVKTRPLHEGTHESRMKAKKAAEFLQPYRPRPETCPALAKRLVKGALGVRLPTDAQERLQERQQLSQAREKKRLAALHREAAWDGSLASNT